LHVLKSKNLKDLPLFVFLYSKYSCSVSSIRIIKVVVKLKEHKLGRVNTTVSKYKNVRCEMPWHCQQSTDWCFFQSTFFPQAYEITVLSVCNSFQLLTPLCYCLYPISTSETTLSSMCAFTSALQLYKSQCCLYASSFQLFRPQCSLFVPHLNF
jgi:hypothetical protein